MDVPLARRIKDVARAVLPHVAFLTILFIAADQLVRTGLVSRFTIPAFNDFLNALLNLPRNPDMPGSFTNHLIMTIYELGAAALIVVGVVLPLALLIGLRYTARRVFEPLLLAFFAIPSIILYPVIYLILGIGPPSKIAMGALVGSTYTFIYVLNAVKHFDQSLVRMASTFTTSRFKILTKVAIPSIIPIMVSAIQLGISYAMVGVIVAEVIASSTGLGFLISWSETTIRVPVMYATIAITIIFAAVVYVSLKLFERWVRGRMKEI
ncbi:MAG: ABC transporter permease subunit [Thaumarchaeota archaeon]|nr:ABC transporter permease subunit [Candidatus Calditenuaceae archaeon]